MPEWKQPDLLRKMQVTGSARNPKRAEVQSKQRNIASNARPIVKKYLFSACFALPTATATAPKYSAFSSPYPYLFL